MKITCSRARRLKIAVSVYCPTRGARPDHRVREDFWSRTRRVRSSHPVFGRDAISSL